LSALSAWSARLNTGTTRRLQLGWLIDPRRRLVHVYRPGQPVHTLLAPVEITAEPLLSGFVLDLRTIL
jgi:Uma2 family endonuclease